MKPKPAALAPAGSTRSASRVADTDPRDTLFGNPLAAPAVAMFEEVLGGRPGLVAELLTSPDITPRIKSVLNLTLDPRYDHHSLAYLCAKAGVAPGEVFAAFKDAAIAKAHVHAVKLVAEQIPQIMAEMLQQATTHDATCGTCGGLKVTFPEPTKQNAHPTPVTCVSCDGKGTISMPGLRDVQKLALELIGLTGKNGGIQMIQQNNTQVNVSEGSGSIAGGLAQLQQAVSGILFGGGGRSGPSVIDVIPTEADPLP